MYNFTYKTFLLSLKVDKNQYLFTENFWGNYAKKIEQNTSKLYERKKIKDRKIYLG